MLDKLPAWARHLIIALLPGVLVFVGSTVIPGLTAQGGAAATVAGLLTVLVMMLTPLTHQYGVAKRKSLHRPPPRG